MYIQHFFKIHFKTNNSKSNVIQFPLRQQGDQHSCGDSRGTFLCSLATFCSPVVGGMSYFGLIESLLPYGIRHWWCCAPSKFERVNRLQKLRAVRILSKLKQRESCQHALSVCTCWLYLIFKSLRWLSSVKVNVLLYKAGTFDLRREQLQETRQNLGSQTITLWSWCHAV